MDGVWHLNALTSDKMLFSLVGHNSVDLSVPTFSPRFKILSTPSTLFLFLVKFCIIFAIAKRKDENKKMPGLALYKILLFSTIAISLIQLKYNYQNVSMF